MVYAFTEAEKKEIERSGLSVIEFKSQLGLVKQEAMANDQALLACQR